MNAFELDTTRLSQHLPAIGERLLIRLESSPGRIELADVSALSEATHQIVNVRGYPFLTHLAERDVVISKGLQQKGYWEFAESMVLSTLLGRDSVLVDLGANLGYYTVTCARQMGQGGWVFAAEPDPKNFEVLLANVLMASKQHRGMARIDLQCVALDAQVGRKQLTRFHGNLGMHSLLAAVPKSPTDSGLDQPLAVTTTTLDALRIGSSSRRALLHRRIDVIKADTQGAELDILRGSEQTLALDRPLLCLEFEPYLFGESRCLELLDWLLAHQYDQCRLFYSCASDPLAVLQQLQQMIPVAEVANIMKRQRIGPYATLLVYPASIVK